MKTNIVHFPRIGLENSSPVDLHKYIQDNTLIHKDMRPPRVIYKVNDLST